MTIDDETRERFRALLTALFVDNTVDEALAEWRYRAEHVAHDVERDLALLDAILADPPADLVELMENDGWIHLLHRPDTHTVIPYSRDEHVAWLRDVTERMRSIYEARPRPA